MEIQTGNVLLKSSQFKVSKEFTGLPVLSASVTLIPTHPPRLPSQGLLHAGKHLYQVILSQLMNSDKCGRKEMYS